WQKGRRRFCWREGGETVNSGGGGGGGSGAPRTRFEGQDYDFVFTVDVEEGKPPLKLPYNRTGQDPWFAAQRFIDKHLLARRPTWIRTNAGETPTISQGTYGGSVHRLWQVHYPVSGTSDGGTGRGFSDPFTGGNRYVPGGAGLEAALAANEEYLPYKELQILSAGNMGRAARPSHHSPVHLSQLVQQQAECRSPQLTAARIAAPHAGQSWLGTERRARISRGCVGWKPAAHETGISCSAKDLA
uniref:PFU domain-containing protein n=1 Tax=Macrostomum lignano TaxID=282301 RepID=A0A1I8FD01_9PLAT